MQYRNLKYDYYTDLKQILGKMKKCKYIMCQQRIKQIKGHMLISSFFSYNLFDFTQLIQLQRLLIIFVLESAREFIFHRLKLLKTLLKNLLIYSI